MLRSTNFLASAPVLTQCIVSLLPGEKLAVSFAVAKSANLSIYEWRLEQAVQRNSHIPEELAKSGELHLSRKEINVEIGRLYLLNNAINLETTMLDTPEEFWEGE